MRNTLSFLPAFQVFATRHLHLAAQIGIVLVAISVSETLAQQPPNNLPGQNAQRAVAAPGPQPNGLFAGPNLGPNANTGPNGTQRGGAANADFDSLIDLIESTVANETWAENGGGQADIRPFPGGVLVDAA